MRGWITYSYCIFYKLIKIRKMPSTIKINMIIVNPDKTSICINIHQVNQGLTRQYALFNAAQICVTFLFFFNNEYSAYSFTYQNLPRDINGMRLFQTSGKCGSIDRNVHCIARIHYYVMTSQFIAAIAIDCYEVRESWLLWMVKAWTNENVKLNKLGSTSIWCTHMFILVYPFNTTSVK